MSLEIKLSIRGLTNDIVLDAQPREWYKVAGDKIEIEVKRDMKKRTGVSPDLADYACSGVEGARRRGFIIERIAAKVPEKKKKNPFEQDAKDFQKIQRAKQLQAV